MKTDYQKLTTVVLIVALLVLFLLLYTRPVENQMTQGVESKDGFPTPDTISFYKLNFTLNNQMTGMVINDVTCETKNEQFRLSNIVKEKPVLIYRYSNINCNTCVEAQLEILHTIFEPEEKQIMILCSYQIEREFHIFKKMNKIKFQMFRVPFDAFDQPAEQYNNPYYFVLHPNMKISNIYVPSNSFPEFNAHYLNGIKELLK